MQKEKSFSFLILFMGLLVGYPALTTDIYLPCFPALAKFFSTSNANIQMSLMASMFGIALGQLVIGPMSDKYGRKISLQISLVVIILTTMLCIYSVTIHMFIIFRFFQGLACSSGMVLSRAILADSFTGKDLTKALSVNTAILGLTPALAPVIGGIILLFTQWQGVFVCLLSISLVFLIFSLFVHESLPPHKRSTNSSTNLFNNFLVSLSNKTFLLYVLIFSLTMALMFAYISSSPFIFQEHYNLSPLLYGIFFGINALATTIGAILTSRFKVLEKAIQIGSIGLVSMSIITVIVLLSGFPYLFFEGVIFIMFVFIGLICSSSTAIALELSRENAGTASAILGALSFLFGGIISPLVGFGNILFATSLALLSCSIAIFFLVSRYILIGNRSSVKFLYIWRRSKLTDN